jgi:hypothetical protein
MRREGRVTVGSDPRYRERLTLPRVSEKNPVFGRDIVVKPASSLIPTVGRVRHHKIIGTAAEITSVGSWEKGQNVLSDRGNQRAGDNVTGEGCARERVH